MTFEEFREDYPGFDWDNGEIVFTFKDNAKVIIWNENSLYRTIAQKYFTYVVANWTHTQNVMVVVLHKNERKDKKMTKREKEIRRVILLNCLFDEEKRRTKIEQEAERLHIAGHPDRATKVLNELDDSIIIELRERLKKLDEEPDETTPSEEPEQGKQAAEAEEVDPEARKRILKLCEKNPRIIRGNFIFYQDKEARTVTKKIITDLLEIKPLTTAKATAILEDAADILKEAAAKRTF